jgi:hypothetical protein
MRRAQYLVGSIGLSLILILSSFNVNSNELNSKKDDVEDNNTLTNPGETFKHLNYKINNTVKSKLTDDKNTYYLVDEKKIPKLEVSLFRKDLDFSSFNESVNENKVRVILKDYYTKKSIIKDIVYEADELGCFKINYNVETNESKEYVSDSFKSNAYLIPTEKGLYVINLQTYSEDDNDYKWEEFLNGVDVQGLKDYLQKVKEEKEKKKQLKQLKSEIKGITCLSSANSDEKQRFNDQKVAALLLIREKASVKEVQNAKASLEQVNTDIQSRLDQEAAAAEQARQEEEARKAAEAQAQAEAEAAQAAAQTTTQSGGYTCVDGTNVGDANPHAKGRANACWGHGGFSVNH